MDASAVTVYPIADLPMGNLQDILGQIYGKAVYAADNVGAAIYKAEQAQAKADTIEGQAQWSADAVGFLHYHLQQMGDQIGYTVPGIPASRAAAADESGE